MASLQPTALGILDDALSLPLRCELGRPQKNVATVVADAAGLQRMLERQELVALLSSPSCLLRNAGFELTLGAGLALLQGSRYAYLGFSEAQMPAKAFFEQQMPRLRSAFAMVDWLSVEDYSAAVKRLWQQHKSVTGSPVFFRYSSYCGTGNLLGRMFYRMVFGEAEHRANEIRNQAGMGGSAVEVLEGEAACRRRHEFAAVIGLDDLWLEFTALPCVIAVWQRAQHQISSLCRTRLLKACELAEARMKVEPSTYFGKMDSATEERLTEVWKKVTLRLGAQELRGLLVFLHFVQQLDQSNDNKDHLTVKMIRWQQRET